MNDATRRVTILHDLLLADVSLAAAERKLARPVDQVRVKEMRRAVRLLRFELQHRLLPRPAGLL